MLNCVEKYKVVGTPGEERDGFVVEVERRGGEVSCPRCSCRCLYQHGKAKPRKVLHSGSRGRRIYLLMSRQRWRCCGCGHSLGEGAPLLRPYSRLTRQAEEEIRGGVWHAAPPSGEEGKPGKP